MSEDELEEEANKSPLPEKKDKKILESLIQAKDKAIEESKEPVQPIYSP